MRVNEADLDWTTTEHGETAFRRKRLAAAAGGERLGCSLYELPAGRKSWPFHFHGGHRVINDGDDTLRYLALSTMNEPDVTVYPDSDKIGVYAGSAPGSDDPRSVAGYYRRDDDVDYWLDEG
jgi:uncharacterized cupin superfamily protein